MNKQLMAVAVAGALAFPALAFAQSSVTISGVLKVGVDNLKIDSPAASRAGKNTSEMRVTDNSSRIIFNMVEDLGNNLAAIGQIDVRFSTDIGANGPNSATSVSGATMSAGGNTWVGLRSKTMGTVIVGRQDLHYGLFELNEIAAKAGALMGTSVGLFDFMPNGVAIAGGTRTNNVVMYDSPSMGGFDVRVAWSSNPTGQEADLSPNGSTNGLTTRKGNAWNINPKFTAGNWGVRYSYWQQKSDGGTNPSAFTTVLACTAPQLAAQTNVATLGGCGTVVNNPADQRGDTVLGWMTFGGLKVALGWNKSSLTGTDITNGGAGVKTNERQAWTLPVNYTFGPNTIYAHYTQARDDKQTAAKDGAKMWAIAYVYELSKRTSLGLTYAKIKNDSGAAYGFFTNASSTQFGSIGSASNLGEAPQLLQATVRHAF